MNAAVYNDPYSYAQQWNFDVQRELPGGLALSAGLCRFEGYAPARAGPATESASAGVLGAWAAGCRNRCQTRFSESLRSARCRNPRVAHGQLLRPYPQYTGFQMKNPTNRNSIYHSAQLNLEKRFGKGGSITAAYTWSKLISDTDTITGWLEPGGGAGNVQNNYNIRAERSLALYDTPHRAVISYIVDLPFGKGQPFRP